MGNPLRRGTALPEKIGRHQIQSLGLRQHLELFDVKAGGLKARCRGTFRHFPSHKGGLY